MIRPSRPRSNGRLLYTPPSDRFRKGWTNSLHGRQRARRRPFAGLAPGRVPPCSCERRSQTKTPPLPPQAGFAEEGPLSHVSSRGRSRLPRPLPNPDRAQPHGPSEPHPVPGTWFSQPSSCLRLPDSGRGPKVDRAWVPGAYPTHGTHEHWLNLWRHAGSGDCPGSPVRSEASAQGQVTAWDRPELATVPRSERTLALFYPVIKAGSSLPHCPQYCQDLPLGRQPRMSLVVGPL